MRNILEMLSAAMFATTAGWATLAADRVVMVGKRTDNRTILPAGRIDFLKTGNLLLSVDDFGNDFPVLLLTANIRVDHQYILANHGMNDGFAGQRKTPTVYDPRARDDMLPVCRIGRS